MNHLVGRKVDGSQYVMNLSLNLKESLGPEVISTIL